ncbi:uncharacterized protein [Argopecten irradians]|uniref:uncharacterized protein n=1 Tax=Argopecten irradians TaxID=31199 RepID=UPI0037113DD1
MEFRIGGHTVKQNTIIAKIEHAGIIGIDFLTAHNGEISFGTQTLRLGGRKVPVSSHVKPQCARVRVCETVTIPQNSEMCFPGRVEGHLDGGVGVVEPVKFITNKQLLLAKTVVAPEEGKSIPLSILNLTGQPVTILENTYVGRVEAVDKVLDESVNIHDKSPNLPPHLQNVVDRTSDKLTKQEQGEVENLVNEYQDIFAAPGEMLSQTGIVEHNIDTGQARPIKIPPDV